MSAETHKKIKRCRNIALLGIIVMGIGSFMACLGNDSTTINIGNGLLMISIGMTAYGFTFWRP